MVVDVSYISKEHSEDATTASSGVTGILAVQGAFAEHAERWIAATYGA